MSDDHRNRFLWFLAGLSVGAVTVALYAPKSGVETRRALRSKAEQSRNRLRHHANRVREQASDWADRLKHKSRLVVSGLQMLGVTTSTLLRQQPD